MICLLLFWRQPYKKLSDSTLLLKCYRSKWTHCTWKSIHSTIYVFFWTNFILCDWLQYTKKEKRQNSFQSIIAFFIPSLSAQSMETAVSFIKTSNILRCIFWPKRFSSSLRGHFQLCLILIPSEILTLSLISSY